MKIGHLIRDFPGRREDRASPAPAASGLFEEPEAARNRPCIHGVRFRDCTDDLWLAPPRPHDGVGRVPGRRTARAAAGRRDDAGAQAGALAVDGKAVAAYLDQLVDLLLKFPGRRFVVYGGPERFPLAEDIDAVSLVHLCSEFAAAGSKP